MAARVTPTFGQGCDRAAGAPRISSVKRNLGHTTKPLTLSVRGMGE
jgi:hypothetical protein